MLPNFSAFLCFLRHTITKLLCLLYVNSTCALWQEKCASYQNCRSVTSKYSAGSADIKLPQMSTEQHMVQGNWQMLYVGSQYTCLCNDNQHLRPTINEICHYKCAQSNATLNLHSTTLIRHMSTVWIRSYLCY